MSGTVSLIPHKHSWHGVLLSAGSILPYFLGYGTVHSCSWIPVLGELTSASFGMNV